MMPPSGSAMASGLGLSSRYMSSGGAPSFMPSAYTSSRGAGGYHQRRALVSGTSAGKFTQPPPLGMSRSVQQQQPSSMGDYMSAAGLGFGGSSGPGCGGSDFWNELAQFGIYPSSVKAASETGSSGLSLWNYPSLSPRRSAFDTSPLSSPSRSGAQNYLFGGGSASGGNNTTSLLPTPHSPSPLLTGNAVCKVDLTFVKLNNL